MPSDASHDPLTLEQLFRIDHNQFDKYLESSRDDEGKFSIWSSVDPRKVSKSYSLALCESLCFRRR